MVELKNYHRSLHIKVSGDCQSWAKDQKVWLLEVKAKPRRIIPGFGYFFFKAAPFTLSITMEPNFCLILILHLKKQHKTEKMFPHIENPTLYPLAKLGYRTAYAPMERAGELPQTPYSK